MKRPMKKTGAMKAAERFFYLNAGYSYGAGETPEQGRKRCARTLARAERAAANKGFSYRWSIDPHGSSADWIEPNEDGGRDNNPWQVWQCAMYNRDGRIVDSLHGIDFGRGGEPWGDNYKRVVEAELAIDGLTNEPQGKGY
jgi:hypothetical protein